MSTQGSSSIVGSNRGPSPGEAYGVAGLTQKMQGITFPISKQEILDRWGDEKFQWAKEGQTLTLRDCLQDLPEELQAITPITQSVSDCVQ